MGWDCGVTCHTLKGADFNPPIPCGMGHDSLIFNAKFFKFQSTHPVWDGTLHVDRDPHIRIISIHPSRVGWDIHLRTFAAAIDNFNPPIPCGMGLKLIDNICDIFLFQSTHPVWDGTTECPAADMRVRFQSTHPVWDGTCVSDGGAGDLAISIHPSRVGWDISPSAVR